MSESGVDPNDVSGLTAHLKKLATEGSPLAIPVPVVPVGRRHYEYRAQYAREDAPGLTAYLNRFATEGWELLALTLFIPCPRTLLCVFRRELQEETT